jgi:hypothetical protein
MLNGQPGFVHGKILPVKLQLLCCILFSFFLLQLNAQSPNPKGLPFITNYRYQDYNGDGVNWWAVEDDKGVMYFANETGILVYDGASWENIKPPAIKEVRSLAKGKDGKIYVGTTGDIGYLAPGKNGKLQFVSLKNLLPEKDRVFKEVWQTNIVDDKIYFGCSNKIFVWDYKKFSVLQSKDGFHQGAWVNGKFYCRIWNRVFVFIRVIVLQ